MSNSIVTMATRVNSAIESLIMPTATPTSRKALATIFAQCAVHQLVMARLPPKENEAFFEYIRAGFDAAAEQLAMEDKIGQPVS